MSDNSQTEDIPPDCMEADASTGEKEKQPEKQRSENVPQTPSSYIETLPKAVKRRINALKQLQVKCAHIEARFYEEVHDLERKYAALYQPLLEKGELVCKFL